MTPIELFVVVEQSEPYAYTNISTSICSITPRPRVLLLPTCTVQSSTEELLSEAGLAPTEEGKTCTYERKIVPAASLHSNPPNTAGLSINVAKHACWCCSRTGHNPLWKKFHGCPLDPQKFFYVKNISVKI